MMRDAGVIAPSSFYLHVRQNGKFYGLFAFVETPDSEYLKVGAKYASIWYMLFEGLLSLQPVVLGGAPWNFRRGLLGW
jgi:hypothetical protein